MAQPSLQQQAHSQPEGCDRPPPTAVKKGLIMKNSDYSDVESQVEHSFSPIDATINFSTVGLRKR